MENSSIYSKSKRNLTNEQRYAILETLLIRTQRGKLKRGSIQEIAASFSVHTATIARIWRQGKAAITTGELIDVASKMPTRVGRKRVQIEPASVIAVPLRRRTNIRTLSTELKLARSTVHRRIKEGMMRPHSNALKPFLSEECKRKRLQFCLSMIEQTSIATEPIFKDMYNYVHIDEKWFYMTKESEKFYLLPQEDEPLRTCKSKRFITKVMFLAAVARPRFDDNHNEVFSGKIGIFPFTIKEPAKRSSKNREAGTLVTKAITAVTKDITRSYLIEKVLPAIRSKWPQSSEIETIYIQQDNARPHIQPWDVDFVEAARADGFDIQLLCQPPSSPDMNVLDLGFFRAIQSLQHQEAPTTVDELVAAVEKSFEELTSESLNRVFLSLQSCMVEVMKDYGGNNYKVPHLGKSRLMREGNLPSQIPCELHIVENALSHLQDQPFN
ncbi:hypothetical protein Vadar_026303 [Vaccinium darrowii]|uniref:Uncharacterized protein n=1 Tax=Vaccinium darrowii TaxID=229202 RepID=A0ACB7X4M2_9ERIC|nr:hypothetical protein Vadar_026303 [Vaccinium darrowii]